MIPYASRTGTKRNLDALRGAGWHLLVSARGVLRHEGFPYALDNGAWTAFQKGEPFDEAAFLKAIDLLGAGAEWIVIPDIVSAGHTSLGFSLSWLPRLAHFPRLLLAVQDGLKPSDVSHLLSPRIGVFLGGSTEWKESTMRDWGAICRRRGAWFHVGRVNTRIRIRLCKDAGADSFDGSSPSRYCKMLPRLDAEVRQMHLWGGG